MKKGTSKYYPFDTARELIRSECIGSVVMYYAWYKHNKPVKLPKRPDIIYRKYGWISWNDFLGNNNEFIHKKAEFIPFEEARKFARSLGLKSFAEWIAYAKSGDKPDNIPARPDYFYKEDWFSWKDWLRGNIKEIVKETVKILPILYIIKVPNTPANVVKIDVTNGGKQALLEAQRNGAKIIATFEYINNLDWRSILRKYANNYHYGEYDDYMFNMNPASFIFEISRYLQPFKF